jgi:tripartite-type tricarboxylate transporter receptor subunit TctC
MVRSIRSLAGGLVLAVAAMAGGAAAQAFPDHYVKLIVPFAPGGATDVLGRILGKRMGEILGQSVVVENHPGAGGTVGTDFVARQPADGYTLLLVNAIPHTASRRLYPDLKYDPVRSFTPIGALGFNRYILVVNNDLPAADYAAFVRLVKASPGKYNFASAGMGSAPHLAMELYLRAAGVDLVHVPYQGSGPAMTDLVGGRVQAAMDNVAAMPLIKSGKVRALAITGRQRAAALPDVPTFAEVGLAGYEVTGTWGLIAPAGVPADRVTVLADALARAVQDPAVRETLIAQGIDPETGTAAQYGAVLVRESDKWSKLIDDAKIKL